MSIVKVLLVLPIAAAAVALIILYLGAMFIQSYKKIGPIGTFIVFSALPYLAVGASNSFSSYSPSSSSYSSSSSSSKTSSSSSSSVVVTPQQLYKIVKGCCSGAGGTYSPAAQDCVGVQSNWNAFTSCVGKGKVRYPNGNVHSYSGSEFVR